MLEERENYLTSLIAGGSAGLVVDITLFPIDTIKTRLQSAQGFFKAGGFRNVYRGIVPQAIGSAPSAALFFCTYDAFKRILMPIVPVEHHAFVFMAGAAMGETVACLIRVPVEVIKQRKQTSIGRMSSSKLLIEAYREGIFKGVYRGFFSTVIREIPFSLIQFPLWEGFKYFWQTNLKNNNELLSWEVAVCGALAGGISAFVTTPLDVAKTRIMLADKHLVSDHELRITNTLLRVYQEDSFKGLFSGWIPRTLWITLGGAIFFGTYDLTKQFWTPYLV